MPLRSMTGFARSQGNTATSSWQWELRSVNGRSLEVRFRVPPGLDALEAAARELCLKRLARGTLSVALTLERTAGGTVIRLNEALLQQVSAAAKRAQDLCRAPAATLDSLLAQRGVLELVEASDGPAEAEARNAAMLASFDQALTSLIAHRAKEGERLRRVLLDQIAEIERLTGIAETSPQRTPARISARLREQVQRLSGSGLDPDRLHQEAMLLAVKADIEEELQRLKSHVEETRALLSADEAVGRKLDFLAQEFMREANTLCSKSNDADITKSGLALKVVIDQMREQVQNIE
jgi:uncharacterized protein (TIGR00255 family)